MVNSGIHCSVLVTLGDGAASKALDVDARVHPSAS